MLKIDSEKLILKTINNGNIKKITIHKIGIIPIQNFELLGFVISINFFFPPVIINASDFNFTTLTPNYFQNARKGTPYLPTESFSLPILTNWAKLP